MTVTELRDILSSFPPNACVMAGTADDVRQERLCGIGSVEQTPRARSNTDGVCAERNKADGAIYVNEGCCYLVLDPDFTEHGEAMQQPRRIGGRP